VTCVCGQFVNRMPVVGPMHQSGGWVWQAVPEVPPVACMDLAAWGLVETVLCCSRLIRLLARSAVALGCLCGRHWCCAVQRHALFNVERVKMCTYTL
jgi:hypothetical protein